MRGDGGGMCDAVHRAAAWFQEGHWVKRAGEGRRRGWRVGWEKGENGLG